MDDFSVDAYALDPVEDLDERVVYRSELASEEVGIKLGV